MFFSLLLASLILIASTVILLLIRTFQRLIDAKQIQYPKFPLLDIDENVVSEHLSRAIQFKTVSWGEIDFDQNEMAAFVKYIEKSFPRVYSCPWIQKKVVNKYSLLFKCVSSNEEKNILTGQSKPWMLIGHLDVVPVGEHDTVNWTRPPFSGDIITTESREYIYGRGSLDAKDIVFGTLEALELAIKNGRRPKNKSFYLVFGHDEETGGLCGAQKVAQFLKDEMRKNREISNGQIARRGVEKPIDFILDEGFNIFDDLLTGQNLGLISIAEKVCCKVTLTANTKPGHSSMPSKDTAISILSSAVNKLQNFKFGSMISKGGPEVETMKLIAPFIKNWFLKIAFSNSDLFAPLISKYIAKHPLMGSFVQTVSCVTKIQGGIKDNVVPSEAKAVVMQRIYPLQSLQEIMAINREVVADDRIKMEVESLVPQIPLSNYGDVKNNGSHSGYHYIKKTVLQLFKDTVVAPIIMPGATDSKHFVDLANDIYRFSPVVMSTKDLRGVHGNDERIRVQSYGKLIEFYYRLIENVSGFTDCSKMI